MTPAESETRRNKQNYDTSHCEGTECLEDMKKSRGRCIGTYTGAKEPTRTVKKMPEGRKVRHERAQDRQDPNPQKEDGKDAFDIPPALSVLHYKSIPRADIVTAYLCNIARVRAEETHSLKTEF